MTTISSWTADGTINLQWPADADVLVEPHIGCVAFITENGPMQARVETYDGVKLTFKT